MLAFRPIQPSSSDPVAAAEFVRLNKPFRMMSYPNRSHSISEGANTTLHLRELMTSFLHEKLPAGAR